MKKLISRILALCLTLSFAVLPASALDLEVAKALLNTYYVDGLPPELLEMDSLEEILAALNDPYTVYMDSSRYDGFMQIVNGEVVVGIGVSIENAFDNGYPILSILPNSPALEAGLQPGDRIIEADGVELSADTNPSTLITGPEGSSVTIAVLREGKRLELTLERRSVPVPIVTYELVDGTAYINCVSFGESTAPTVRQALEELEEETAVWLFDLRSNPGGESHATAQAAGLFTGPGVMFYFRDGAGNLSYTALKASFEDLTDKPAILLLSAYSASGSELFASDIRDYGAGIAIGQRSFGKGIAQLIFDADNAPTFEDGEALKVTAYRFFSPDGATNHIVGILPTLVISEENTPAAALLLTAPEPEWAAGHLRLELSGCTFYIDLSVATAEENRPAFTELLEALPPSAKVEMGSSAGWQALDIPQYAQKLRLDYHPRTFTDVSDSPYAREIHTLAACQLLEGFPDGSFRPGGTVTRAQFAAMLASALNLPDKPAPFSDVDAGSGYAGAVGAMTELGFLSGYADGTFRPDEPIRYQEAVTVLSSVAAWTSLAGYNLAQSNLPAGQWLDYYEFAEWAQIPARNLDTLGALLDGPAPTDLTTREMAAAMLCRLMENTHMLWR